MRPLTTHGTTPSRSRARLLAIALVAAAACNGASPLVDPPPLTKPVTPPSTDPNRATSLTLSARGQRPFAVVLGTPEQLSIIARDAQQREVLLSTPPVYESRHPQIISVDATGVATAMAVGTARLVVTATLPSGNQIADSLDVGAVCSNERLVRVSPKEVLVAVGDTAYSTATLVTCGGRNEIAGNFTWSTFTTTTLSVDATTGAIVGKIPGQGSVTARSTLYPLAAAFVLVTVVPPTPK